jgi:hypothetical protein
MKENKLADLSIEFAVKALEFANTVEGHYSLKNQFERARASLSFIPDTFDIKSPLIDVSVRYIDGIDISGGDEKNITLTFCNNGAIYDATSYSLSFRWWLPDGFSVSGKKGFILRNNYIRNDKTDLIEKFTIHASDSVEAKNRLVLEINIDGTSESVYVPITFLG